jgi:hypothetical protein
MAKCKVCKAKFTPRFSTLQPCCENPKCIIEYTRQLKEKKEAKEWKERKKKAKEKLKTLSQYESDAKKSFQKWVRKRDEGLPCISCGTFETMRWDGGHLFKAEIFSGVIFDERNCSKQCIKCNTVLNGNEAEYSIRLKERIGIVEFLDLQINAMETRKYKYTRDELIEIKNKYDNLLKGFNN